MASDSYLIPARERREVYLLIGECCELGADPYVWRLHMLRRFQQLVGAVAAVAIDAVFDANIPGIGAKVRTSISVDDYSTHEKAILSQCLRSMPLEANPLGRILFENSLRNGPTAAARQEWIDKQAWGASAFIGEYMSQVGWFETLQALSSRSADVDSITLTRAKGEPPFSCRHARLLELFLREITAISAVRLSPWLGNSLQLLPKRELEVLLALAEGDEEKQVAIHLGISPNTVREYIRRLFLRYSVNSRSALLMKASRQVHAIQLADTLGQKSCWIYQSRRAANDRNFN